MGDTRAANCASSLEMDNGRSVGCEQPELEALEFLAFLGAQDVICQIDVTDCRQARW